MSFQVINLLHFGQNDLPDTTPFSKGKRWMQTLAKLPQSAPRTSTNMKSTEYDYNLMFDVMWINPSITYWTIRTASCRWMYKLGVLIIISIVEKFTKNCLKY